MEGTFDYIEAYFEHRLSAAERQVFEARCSDDPAFAGEVAVYISTRQALKEELLDRKRKEWASLEPIGAAAGPLRSIPRITRRFAILAGAAAAVLAIVIVYLITKPSSPQQLAKGYVGRNYAQLSATLDGSLDDWQRAILAYNNKEYEKAATLFERVAATQPENSDAKKYAGIVYLVTGQYDKALNKFSILTRTPGLLNNPGLFLQAVTLLERDSPGDKNEARRLLGEVVQQQLEGSKEASAWLKSF